MNDIKNFNKLDLGILYKDGKIVNHRSLIKVIFNPLLRYFGYQIGTILNDNGTLGLPKINKCKKSYKIIWSLEYNEYDTIIKKRRII